MDVTTDRERKGRTANYYPLRQSVNQMIESTSPLHSTYVHGTDKTARWSVSHGRDWSQFNTTPWKGKTTAPQLTTLIHDDNYRRGGWGAVGVVNVWW